MTEEQAIAEVTLSAQTDAFPSLTPEQVTALVQKNKRASVWEANKDYFSGDRVQPTVRNGHFYECRIAGTSGATEPDWTAKENAVVYDDSSATVLWLECGIDVDGNLYNVRNAIHSAWLLKASMAANQFDTKIDDTTLTRSQIYENCMAMAKAWSPFD